MLNKAYSLSDGAVIERDATPEELASARDAANAKLKVDPADWAMRSCWKCNPSHSHFLENTNDGFLFSCVMGCGRWYYGGIDITGDGAEVD